MAAHCRIPHAVARNGSVSAHAKSVLLALDSHADWTTGESFPSIKTLRAETGLSQPTITKAIVELMSWGLVGKTKRKTGQHALYIVAHRVPKAAKHVCRSEVKAANESSKSGAKAANDVCTNHRRELEDLYESPIEQIISTNWWNDIEDAQRARNTAHQAKLQKGQSG